MPSVVKRGQKFYLKWKGADGRWCFEVSSAKTKTEARRLATELEQKAERQRRGLEALLPADGGGTLADLLEWWLETYSKVSASHATDVSRIRCHLLTSELASLPLIAVTPGKLEMFLHAKGQELAAQSVNHLRGLISRAFNAARRTGRFTGPNPAATVKKRKIPHRLPDYLRAEEVPPLLKALAPRWRPLFAAALYTGMRKGELLGLRKPAVDLGARLLTVARSYERDTTKGGHADAIPIAAELVPYMEAAIAASPSELVFPRPDGSMMRRDVGLEGTLRRAMARAGIVTGYRHVCRRTGCKHEEEAPDAGLRRCPEHGAKLWPKPRVRPLRFHDLRHTTASLLLMAGCSPAAVQRVLRHSDPKLTMRVYGHLAPDYLRAEVDRLSFGAPPPLPAPFEKKRAVANCPEPAGPPSPLHHGCTKRLDNPSNGMERMESPPAGNLNAYATLRSDGNGWTVPAPDSGAKGHRFESCIARSVRGRNHGEIPEGSGPSVLRDAGLHHGCTKPREKEGGAGHLRAIDGGADHLFTVRRAAERLGVSTATVYSLCERGELPHVRISNAIRIAPADLARFIEGHSRGKG